MSHQVLPYTSAYKEAQLRIQVPPHSTVVAESSSIVARAIPRVLGMPVALISAEEVPAKANQFRLETFSQCLRDHQAVCAVQETNSCSEIKVGSSVLAKCSVDGLHYLGLVDKVEAQSDAATVTFAGYGNTEVVCFTNIYALLWPQPAAQDAADDAATGSS